MSDSHSTFQRHSLVDQISAALRVRIHAGKGISHLPAERKLAEEFETSRPLIRKALHRLRHEGLLEVVRGHPARIICPPKNRPASGKPKQRVALLFGESQNSVGQWPLLVIDALRRKLYARGIDFEVLITLRQGGQFSPAHIRQLVKRSQATDWILAGMPAPVQKWFQDQNLNTILMGNPFPGISFPYVNDDLKAVAHHAATRFLGHGYRRIVFLRRNQGSAGERDEEVGFLQAFKDEPSGTGRVITHSGKVDAIQRRLQALFSETPAPQGLLVSHAMDLLVVTHWLLARGLRMPGDVSLLSFQWESFLERLRPLPAWYHSDPEKHARKLCRSISHPDQAGLSPGLILPEFVKNEALIKMNPNLSPG